MSQRITLRISHSARLLYILLLPLALSACEAVPVTGRSQLFLIDESEVQKMGLATFQQALADQPVAQDPKLNALVQRVGSRIAQATGRTDLEWDFRVIDSNEKNAWCAPGGKVVVYTGILDITQDEAGLATVLGHEVAHAIARHGAERLSQQLLANLTVTAAAVGAGIYMDDPETMEQMSVLLGLGAQYGILLPFSREHESEADRMGLIYMAKAGYDPRAAVSLWQRMAAAGDSSEMAEFVSTHPANETRIRNIEAWLPEALQYYNGPDRASFVNGM
jgi:predicted Zn-dependent protease